MRPTQLHLTAARLSRAAYLDSPEAELGASLAVRDLPVEAKMVDCGGGTQVLFAGRFVAFRGTDELADVADDLGCLARPVSGLIRAWGRAPAWHRGFERAWKCAEPFVSAYVRPSAPGGYRGSGPIVYCGHSLGGAIAMLAAAHSPYPVDVVTFGAPRTGNATAINRAQNRAVTMARFVMNSDIVPRLPPASSGLVHPSRGFYYIDCDGTIHESPSWAFCVADRVRGRLRGGVLDSFRDHSMDGYVAALSAAAGRPAQPRSFS